MASTSIIQYSSCSRDVLRTYDVFVSFRGDTRNNFTDHLFGALARKAIHFFKDDTKLKKGKHILPELLQAIHGSQILVVVFSKDYASSKWCLRELEKIASYIKGSGKHVLPIFYDVTPSEVRNQSGNFKEAFDEYRKRFKNDEEKMDEVQRWSQALLQVANLSGWEIGDKAQYTEIEKIVQNIKKLLQKNIVSSPNDDLVGIESCVQELEKLLFLDSVEVVLSLGICGMPGIGKTTLVTTLCDKIHHYFEFNCFIEDVGKSFQNSSIFGLRKQLLCQAPEENSLEIYNVFPRTNFVSHGRRLIVLDNVDHIDQLEKLALKHTSLGAGSRIIIISKDKRILEDYGVNHIYHVQALNDNDAIQLFNKHAFKGNYIMSEYEKLKNDIFLYLGGHPLLIKVLGRHLAGQSISKWSTALAKLRENPKNDILVKLRISFDELEQNEKEIFLDIACFFHWYHEYNNVMEILHFRGFDPESGLETLLKKSLITDYDETWVEMPSLLIDLGKYIVKEKSPKEPRKWSRLWNYEDTLKVFSDNKAAKNLEGIVVDYYDSRFLETTIDVDALSKMNQLKLLILIYGRVSGSFDDFHLSNELTYVSWEEYPSKCLPSSFQPNNLVELTMRHSNIEQLWKDKKPLPNLKRLDLSYSEYLVEMPNFEEAPNLEWLKFDGCIRLKKIHPSVCCLKQLKCLNLKNCKSLESLPTSSLEFRSLEYLTLSGCSNLYNTPLLEDTNHFKKHWMAKVKALLHFRSTSSIDKKSFTGSDSSLLSLPNFPCLRDLDLSFCNLHKISDAIGNLCNLERLNLSGNKFEKMPTLEKLSKLVHINLAHCKEMKYLSELPSQTDWTLGFYGVPSKMDGSSLFDWKGMGLHIFNCPKVVENKEWSRMSFSWMMQMAQVYYFDGGTNIESIIPGNEIPSWFNNQHMGMGNSIKVDATPLQQDGNKWIAIAFCAVFVPHHQNKSVLDRNFSDKGLPYRPQMLLNVDLVTHKSDHMCLFYFTRSHFSWAFQSHGDFHSNDIEVKLEAPRQDWNFEVKKYGYRWVYKQDLQPLNSEFMLCNDSSSF